MKIWFSYLLLLLLVTGCRQADKNKQQQEPPPTIPGLPGKPLGWVSDFEGILKPEEISKLDSMISGYEEQTSNEIAIVTYEPTPEQLEAAGDFSKLALAFSNNWGVGKKEKDNGVTLIASTPLREIRINIGEGLLTKLTFKEAQQIIDELIIPAFKKGDWYGGFSGALREIMLQIK